MNSEEYIELALNGNEPLKLILKGYVEENGGEKVGVVAVVYASLDVQKIKEVFKALMEKADDDEYYMVYSVGFDEDLTKLEHFPSIAITKNDLMCWKEVWGK